MSSDRIDTIDHKANAQDDWTVRAVGLATTLLILLPAPVGAQAGPATDEIALSELSVTGTGPAVERAGGPVIGYRACNANQ